MYKLMLLLSALALPAAVHAADTTAADLKDSQQITRKVTRVGDHIIKITEPMRFVGDPEQQKALGEATDLIRSQIAQLNQQYDPKRDPHGDLKALLDATNSFDSQLDSLVQLAAKEYGDAMVNFDQYDTLSLPFLLGKVIPTGFIVFIGAEYDKNFVSIPWLGAAAKGGGSVSVGVVVAPQKVTLIDYSKNPAAIKNTWGVSTSLVVIPNVNAGVGVTATGGGTDTGTNARGGIGLIFGQLDSASDIQGWTGGISGSAAWPGAFFGANGANVKALAIKNSAKEGAVTNVLVMIGAEKGLTAASHLKLDFEGHFNVSYIWDFTSFFGGLSKTVAGVAKKVSDGESN